MTIEDMIAKQIRIERQEQPTVASLSFEAHAANAFQSYVRAAISFTIKRGGFLYGTVDDDNKIKVSKHPLPSGESSVNPHPAHDSTPHAVLHYSTLFVSIAFAIEMGKPFELPQYSSKAILDLLWHLNLRFFFLTSC